MNDRDQTKVRIVRRNTAGSPRLRIPNSIRFIDPRPFHLQRQNGIYYSKNDYIWLVNKWLEKNNFKNPTYKDIQDGLLLEIKYQMASMKSGETEI